MRRFRTIWLGLLLIISIGSIGCGGSDNNGFAGFQKLITGLTIAPKPATKAVGQTQQFSATAASNDGTSADVTGLVSWSSSNPSIVTINSSGLATAVNPGTAIITASGAGFNDTANFTVTSPVTGTPATLIGLNSTGNGLVRFASNAPGSVTNTPVTNLNAGEILVGIDVRPQNRNLYGLGFNSATNAVTLYNINPDNGFATPVGITGTFVAADGVTAAPITGTAFGFDFNPTVDRIRVVTNTNQNFRINPNTGALVDGDAVAAGTQMDGAITGATGVDGAAYTNNEPNVTVTTLYTLDDASNRIFIQNPANGGTQTNGLTVTLNGATLDFSSANGFDILPGVNAPGNNAAVTTGSAVAALTVGGATNLYSIDLTNGQATLLGSPGTNLSGLTALSNSPGQALVALSGTNLLRFNSTTPGTTTTVGLTAFNGSETLVGIDYRPATGQLYALGVNAVANTASLYLVDPQTGVTSGIGPNGSIAFLLADGVTPVDLPDPATSGYGFDFNPAVDRVRVTTGSGLNFRANPNNGQAIDGDLANTGVQTDGAINGLAAGSTGVSGASYTNSFGQPLTGGVTTLYTLDSDADQLLIQTPPNNGTQTSPLALTLSGAPLNFSGVNGFDIPSTVAVSSNNAAATGSATAILNVGGTTGLYTINLATGAATFLGATASAIQGLAIGN